MADRRRYVVLGAGAIGGAMGGRLFQHGHAVTLIARGDHLATIQERGLVIEDRLGEVSLPVPAVASPADIEWSGDEVVILGVKSQDTAGALRDLSLHAPASTPIVCAQNGVSNEDAALRWFDRVYGAWVFMPTIFLEAGRIFVRSAPVYGLFDIGRYPTGVDGLAIEVADDLSASGFDARPNDCVMRLKYRKLIGNLHNALDAAVGQAPGLEDVSAAMRREAEAVFDALAIDCATAEEDRERRGSLLSFDPVPGMAYAGSSTWQSLARGNGSSEVDYLNGEVVRLGRLAGIEARTNAVLQRLGNEMAAARSAPGSLPVDDLLRAVRE